MLSDGTNDYIYGQGRVAQVNTTGTEYFLGDTLGSVRQMADAAGAVTLAKAYDPYGVALQSGGNGSTNYGFTGEMTDSTGLVYLRARYYAADTGRFISRDTWHGDESQPISYNAWLYGYANPINYIDPSGHTVRSALNLIRSNRSIIKSVAGQNNIAPIVLAGVVFAENRNDYNFIPGQDWTSIFSCGLAGGPEIKNFVGEFIKKDVSLGITEMSIPIAYIMEHPEAVPDDYASMEWQERVNFKDKIANDISMLERANIITRLKDPVLSLGYAAKYLKFLSQHRDYGDDFALWLSDYNRGLSDWETTSEYGRRIDLYRTNIEHVLNWQDGEIPICIGREGCAKFYDHYFFGTLPE